jgi:low affinity Fe/Cu permease
MDLINNLLFYNVFNTLFGTSFIVITTIFLLIIDEIVKNIVSLKSQNEKLLLEIDQIKNKLITIECYEIEKLQKELQKLKDENSSFNRFIKEEIDEIYTSIKFCNTELFALKDLTIRSSQTFQTGSLDLKG